MTDKEAQKLDQAARNVADPKKRAEKMLEVAEHFEKAVSTEEGNLLLTTAADLRVHANILKERE